MMFSTLVAVEFFRQTLLRRLVFENSANRTGLNNVNFEEQKPAVRKFSELPLPFLDLSNVPACKDPIHPSMISEDIMNKSLPSNLDTDNISPDDIQQKPIPQTPDGSSLDMNATVSSQTIPVLQLAGLSDDTTYQIETSSDDTFNKKEWNDLEDLLNEAVTVPFSFSKDIIESYQVECDPTLNEWTYSRSIPRQPLLSSPDDGIPCRHSTPEGSQSRHQSQY